MSFGPIKPGVKNLLHQDCSWGGDHSWSGIGTFSRESLGATTVSNTILTNPTLATSTAQVQVSPAIQFRANGWRSGTSVSQTVDFREYVVPSTGTSAALGEWKLQYSINGAAYSEGLQYYTNLQDGLPTGLFKVNGFTQIIGNNSSTIDTLQNLKFVNTSGTRTHIVSEFGGTIKWGIQTQNDGYTYYKAAGLSAQHNFQIGTTLGSMFDIIQIYSGGIYNFGGMFANGKVTAGLANTSAPAKLNSFGSVAVRGKLVYGVSTYTLTEDETMVYVDASASNLCTGTPSNSCSSYTGSGEATCNSHSGAGCSWFAGNSCSEFSGTSEGDCETGHSGCTYEETACSGANNTDQSTCESQDDSYGGSCVWDTSTCPALTTTLTCNEQPGCTASENNSCAGFTDTASCNAQTPCSPVVDGDCTLLSDLGGDGTLCATQPECSYDNGTGACTGLYFTACSGFYFDACNGNLCNGNYFTGNCQGTWGAGCQGTATCSNFTSSGTCAAETGCTWSSGCEIRLPIGTSANYDNTSRMYSIMNIGASGTVTVVPNAADTLQSAISMSSQYQEVLLHHHNVILPCTIYSATNQATCEANSPCTWSPAVVCSDYNGNQTDCENNGCTYEDPNCTGAGSPTSCNGQYTSLKRWFKHNTI